MNCSDCGKGDSVTFIQLGDKLMVCGGCLQARQKARSVPSEAPLTIVRSRQAQMDATAAQYGLASGNQIRATALQNQELSGERLMAQAAQQGLTKRHGFTINASGAEDLMKQVKTLKYELQLAQLEAFTDKAKLENALITLKNAEARAAASHEQGLENAQRANRLSDQAGGLATMVNDLKIELADALREIARLKRKR
jgi:hypothetical protein